MRHQGVTMLLLRGDLFQPLQQVAGPATTRSWRACVTASPLPVAEEVLYPGLAEMRTRAQRRRDGIPLAVDIWERFAAAAAASGGRLRLTSVPGRPTPPP